MKPEELIRDSVFQLNLLLWMAREQPPHGHVRPLFHELGFEILYVHEPFSFPVKTSQAISKSGLQVSASPKPDLLLANTTKGTALYCEAKSDSFGVGSSNSEQARGHLLAVGPAFAEVYAPLRSCLLCYVLPSEGQSAMDECLGTLGEGLSSVGLSPGCHSVHGLSIRGSDLVYSWDEAFRRHTGAQGSEVTVFSKLSDDTDPTPLLLVYTDDDSPNPQMQDYYRTAMLNQVHARLLCDLRAKSSNTEYNVFLDDLLEQTTQGVFSYLGRDERVSLRRRVRKNLLSRICKYWEAKQPGCVTLQNDVLKAVWSTADGKEAFIEWLEDRETVFPGTGPPDRGPTLFDEICDAQEHSPAPQEG